jgi:23S rRNA (pseudouridine1915-N3)-methyltransferase
MNFKIYIVGKKIDGFYQEAIQEYQKRLSRYCKINYSFVKNEEQLAKKISNKTYIINISPSSQEVSSEELAQKINDWAVSGISDITIINSSPKIPTQEHLAISSMEMDPGLMTTIIFEQIYRSYRILNNQAYHK